MREVVVGRGREVADVVAHLAGARLVTVVGPGGVGKTTVATAAAAAAAERFPHGVFHVDLTRVESPDAVAGALADQLRFDSFDSLLASPGDLPALIVVDNCEHLLDAAASAIDRILACCTQPTVLATSRSPLELPAEVVVPLAPLAVPPPADPDPASSPAVELFLARARAAGATVDDDDLEVVASLCRRLDGLPLALELAAVRARSLSLREIADRLDAGVEVLARRHYRGERRHRSLAETVRWSYDLLEPSQAALLQRLSVFAGPFEHGTAERIAGAAAPDTFADDLDELVYASLVSVDTSGASTRYRLLDAVRRFALDRLHESGAAEATMDRFVDVVLQAALDAQRGGRTAWRPSMIRSLLAAFDDLGEAIRWCNQHDAGPDRALRLCSLLWVVVHQGRAADVVILARQTVDRWAGHDHRLRPVAEATLATAEYVSGNHALAVELAEPVLERVGQEGPAAVTLRRVLGQARTALGDLDEARALFADGAAVARRQGMLALALELDVAHAQLRAATGDPEGALAALRESCEEAARSGSEVNDVWARTALGWMLLGHDRAEAEAVLAGALRDARRIGYPIATSGNLRSLAYAALLRGDPAAARATLLELLDELLERGAFRADGRLLVDATAALAHVAGHPAAGQLAATARALPFASVVSVAGSAPIDVPVGGADPLPHTQAVRAVKAVLDHLGGADPAPAPPVVDPAPAPALVRRGDVWDLTYDGTTVAVRSTKGLVDLARLLASPGHEVHCTELAGAAVDQGDTGEVIDAEARRRYEDRLRDLQDELDEAEAGHDLARAERAQAEFDALLDHLSAAVGLGGRTRTAAGTTVERARSTVTQRIRGTVRRLEQVHPAVGRHLRASITTGTWCAYRPERPTSWRVEGR